MTTTATGASTNLAKFQVLLRELFQFDCADLDFGIYRIMNHKRDAVDRFVSEQLPAFVATQLDSGPLAQQTKAAEELEQARQDLIKLADSLGEAAFDERGELTERYKTVPASEDYRNAQSRAASSSRTRDVVEAAIYNHLYSFFNRYYDEGDFISKRRYSRNQRYAIPYNGEEVYLHWANSDQYYVKTDEYFRNYDWQAPNGVTVHFRLANADVEQNNVKGERRFFIPRISETEWDDEIAAITIPFEYRPLTTSEKGAYSRNNPQESVLVATLSEVPHKLRAHARALAALNGGQADDGNGQVTHLEHHLRRYVRRNNSDFFIHKDLAGFLNRELDFYLKNEVLNLDNLAVAGQDMAEGWFQQMRLTKAVGGKIIAFLAQIEDFQKMLWEKRKFVTETQYCITLGNIDRAFYPDILTNESQWEEWRVLFDVDGSDRSEAFLQDNPTLVLDTKHFAAKLVDRLMASFSDLDGMTDGLLIHSENWQALNFLNEKHSGTLDCIYVDPPYNTDEHTFIYKNGYKHSSWLAMVSDRVRMGYSLLARTGVFQIAINDTETHNLRSVLDSTFSQENRVATIAAEVNPAGQNLRPNTPALSHDYCHIYAANITEMKMLLRKLTAAELKSYSEVDGPIPFLWDNLRRRGGNSRPTDRPGQVFPLYVRDRGKDKSVRVPSMHWDQSSGKWIVEETPAEGETEFWPIDPQGEARIWRVNPSGAIAGIQTGDISVIAKAGRLEVVKKSYMPAGKKPKTLWHDSKYSATTHGTKLLNDILGQQTFSYPKSVFLVMDCLRFWMQDSATVADYFAGSGTTGQAVINLNRENGGERKFILVEMGEYFDTVLLPRIEKVMYAPEWKQGKPKRRADAAEAERSPRIVKYIRLESYEDALDSIEFDEPGGQLRLAEESDEYLLKYMLGWETRDSRTLLNPADLTSPFTYRLRVHANGEKRERTVDLPETFNYLLGLKVQKRKVLNDNGRRYLVFHGETRAAPGRPVCVIWRETEGWTVDDFARDRDFVARKNLPENADTVYVNGDSAIPGAKPVEPIFKARMFAGVNASTLRTGPER